MSIQSVIESAWENRDTVNVDTKGEIRTAVQSALNGLDSGELRIAQKTAGQWVVHEWLKKAILLSFLLNPFRRMSGAPDNSEWWDKVPAKFVGWDEARFKRAGLRASPTAYVRYSAYIGENVILMPSFVNVGAYVDSGTMIDAWATVGSCAQIGKNCHISGGAGIGGVLEPLQANPVIVEDNCFIGARSEVVEGVIVEEGAVLSMGVFIGASTKIVDRQTGEIHRGKIPAFSVVVPGSLPQGSFENGAPCPNLYCAVIIKTVDAQTRSKTSINDLLRD